MIRSTCPECGMTQQERGPVNAAGEKRGLVRAEVLHDIAERLRVLVSRRDAVSDDDHVRSYMNEEIDRLDALVKDA